MGARVCNLCPQVVKNTIGQISEDDARCFAPSRQEVIPRTFPKRYTEVERAGTIWHGKCFVSSRCNSEMNRPMMMIAWLSLVIVGSLSGAGPDPAAGREEAQASQKKEANTKKNALASMTGCIDEQEGHYLLLDERTRDPIANLEADGFETEGFAKHLGHKVIIRGTSNPGDTRPVFRVRSIETLSESCGAQ